MPEEPSQAAQEGAAQLSAEVSPDLQDTVQDFLIEAAQQNEAAAEAVPEERNRPGPYIAFEKVSKSFGSFDVLEGGFLLCYAGRDALHPGAFGSREICIASDVDGFSKAR